MNAADVKDALRARHPATVKNGSYEFTGAWTCVEEWMNIDLLAVSAWASVGPYPRYARVGYEVKVSRADYRRELAKPSKRARAVAFCHEFYMAVPDGLLKPEEVAWAPPWGLDEPVAPFRRPPCPGAYGAFCYDGYVTFGRGVFSTYGLAAGRCSKRSPIRFAGGDRWTSYRTVCPVCRGAGYLVDSPAVTVAASGLWVPADVGLVTVSDTGIAKIVKRPPRHHVPPPDRDFARLVLTAAAGRVAFSDAQIADLIRWISVRPDRRHATVRGAPKP